MASRNRVDLIGNLGRDPVIRRSPEKNVVVANFSLATNEYWKDKNTGEKQQHTEWHRIVCFGRLAEVVEEFAKQGHLVSIDGRLRTRKWKDKEGTDRYTTEIVARDVQMLNGKPSVAASTMSVDESDMASLAAEADRVAAITQDE